MALPILAAALLVYAMVGAVAAVALFGVTVRECIVLHEKVTRRGMRDWEAAGIVAFATAGMVCVGLFWPVSALAWCYSPQQASAERERVTS